MDRLEQRTMNEPIARVTWEASIRRELPVRVLSVSAAGCLVESYMALPVGLTGRLQIVIDDYPFSEDIRAVRCVPIAGAGVYHIGLEFLRPIGFGIERFLRVAVRGLVAEGR